MQRQSRHTAALVCAALALAIGNADAADKSRDAGLERGRYLVRIMGCNDCHTPGYAASAGKVPEKDWLTGDILGWQGPWGTTFAANLRLYFAGVSERQWLEEARTREMRPPMPWFTLREVRDADLRAVYRFIRSLGPAGEKAPAYLPPGQAYAGPAVVFPAPPK